MDFDSISVIKIPQMLGISAALSFLSFSSVTVPQRERGSAESPVQKTSSLQVGISVFPVTEIKSPATHQIGKKPLHKPEPRRMLRRERANFGHCSGKHESV